MKQHPIWLVANWKMHGNAQLVRDFAFGLSDVELRIPAHITCVYCPPVPYIAEAARALPQNTRLKLGAQNCHEQAKGAHTGETSAAMLADIGASYVILGHSERRAAGETEVMVAAKAKAALAAGIIPILCVGESKALYDAGKTAEFLTRQLASLCDLPTSRYLIAYEPIWAIGSGLTPKSGEIIAAHAHIKSVLGSATCVLYGGSVNAQNAGEILHLSGVSGALIGGASLEIDSMRTIIAAASGQ